MIESKSLKTFPVNILKKLTWPSSNQNILSDDVTYGTDALHLGHTATFFIKCLKWDLKVSPICLDYHIFNPKIKQKNNFLGVSGSSFHFLNWCSKFIFKKHINYTFQIHGNKIQRLQNSRMKWIVLPYLESYFEETKYILIKESGRIR